MTASKASTTNYQYESQVYRSIVLAVGNGFLNNQVRAGLVLKSGIRLAFNGQIKNLLGLEQRFGCDFNSTRYARLFAQTMANITRQKTSVTRSEAEVEVIDSEYNRFLTLIEEQLGLKPTLLQQQPANFTVAHFKELKFLSSSEAETILHPTKKRPQARVDQQPEQESSNQQSKTQTSQPNNQNNFFKFNRSMAWGNKIPGGNFPRHPFYDPRFYPFLSKPYYFPNLKKIVASICALTSLMCFVVILMSMIKPVGITIPGWGIKDHKIVTSGGDGFKLFLTPLQSILGFNWLSVIITPLPGFAIFYHAFVDQKSDRRRYSISRYIAIFAILFYGFSLYTLLFFLIPISFKNYLRGQFGDPDRTQTNVDHLYDFLHHNSIYQAIWIMSIIALVLVLVSIITLIALLFLNPKLDRDKMMKATAEYQKAVMARYNGQEYQVDPNLFQSMPPSQKKSKTRAH